MKNSRHKKIYNPSEEDKEKIKELEKISTNIIITKKEDMSYKIEFENKDILNQINDKDIQFINKVLKINNDKSINHLCCDRLSKMGKLYENLIKNNKNEKIIKTSLFINIFKWFTDIPMNKLDNIINEEGIKFLTINKLKVVTCKEGIPETEYPNNRRGGNFPNYWDFRVRLKEFYNQQDVTFEKLFNNNNNELEQNIYNNLEDKSIIIIQEEINKLKFIPYKEYLKTDHWKETRQKALKKANYKCELCNSVEKLNVHHKTYENKGNEKPEDLIVLCHNCHAKFHDKLDNEEKIDKEVTHNNEDSETLNQLLNTLNMSKEELLIYIKCKNKLNNIDF